MRIPVVGSVLPDTLAAFLPTNFTSLAFFTLSEYSAAVTAPSAPVVLSEDTIQPMLRKSPTVAAVLSLTLGSPVVGLDKSTKPVFLAVVPGTLPPYVSNPDFTFVTFTGSVPLEPDTLKSPSSVLLNLGPCSPPTCTVLKDTSFLVVNVNLLPACVILMFLSASKVTLSPAFTD